MPLIRIEVGMNISVRRIRPGTAVWASALVMLLLMITGSCATQKQSIGTAEVQELWSLDGWPLNVFMGVSAPYSSRERMVREALYQCARSIALSSRLEVTNALVSESSHKRGVYSFATEGSVRYSESDILAILERLTLLEVRGGDGIGVVVIAADEQKPPLPRPYEQSRDERGTPVWVNSPPAVPGWITAVGDTLGYRFIRDSLEAADVQAALNLLPLIPGSLTRARSYAVSDTVRTGSADEVFLQSFEEGVLQISEGALEGFTILARWYDVKSNRYYSLAAVPERGKND
jgi:hypothetical protein